ncbi:MAG: ABC transporter permease [Deltaproteobacteria bacterium]|nr:ABC transporter permease [Deltaproteobacteria bacterium]MBW2340327.1 ABC transporter permease [Deltaproteobacteria bacterium]
MNLINIKAVSRKEFYHLIRDFRSMYLAFIIPLLLILMFGYALSLDVDNVKTMVVDHDRTELSRDFIRKLDASSYFKVIYHLRDTVAAIRYLDQGSTTMAVVIPPGWTEDIKADREAQMQVLLDGSDPNFASLSRGYITAFVEAYNRDRFIDFLNRSGKERIEPPVDGRIRVWFNEDLESQNFIVPGIIAIIIMIVGAMLTSLVIAREYENGTMETVRSLPIRGGEFLIGKAIPYFLIALTDVLVAVFMGQVLFGVVMKSSFWLMVLASTIYISVALSLGLLISIATKSQLVANQIAILVTFLPSMLLSNFVFPVENMPKVFQLLTYIVPATYFIDILNGLYLRGLGLDHLWPSYLVLVGMLVVLSNIGFAILKKEGM